MEGGSLGRMQSITIRDIAHLSFWFIFEGIILYVDAERRAGNVVVSPFDYEDVISSVVNLVTDLGLEKTNRYSSVIMPSSKSTGKI